MIGIDTNVLVRYFVRDDPDQTARADEIIESELSSQQPGYLSVATLVEFCWVLERSYGIPTSDIAIVLQAILSNEIFVVQSELQVHIAYLAVREGRASFADALIAALSYAAGCATTVTFDKKAARLPGFTLI